MRGLDRTPHRLGLALGLAALAGLATADGTPAPACLIDSLDSLPGPTAAVDSNSPVLQLLAGRRADTDDSLVPVCVGERLASLKIKLVPGQTRSVMLVALSGIELPLQATRIGSGQEIAQTGAWQLELRPVDALVAPQPVQLIEVVVTAGAANLLGQQQSFRLLGSEVSSRQPQDLSLELILESLDGERMFRDNFKVDPSVGQFSQRTDRFGAPADRSGQDAGSATL